MAKKPARKILRVGLIQNQKILEERLFRSPQTVKVGHDYKKNTLVVPASKLPSSFSVFKWDGNGYFLQFNDKMEGRVSRGGTVETLADLRKKDIAKKKGDLYQLKLTPSMRGRVTLGEATILFQFVTPPPKKARPALPASMRGGFAAGIDGPLAALILISALIQVGFVVYLEMQDWPIPEDRDVRIQDRMVEVLADDPPELEEEEELEGDDPEPEDEGQDEIEEEEEEEAPEEEEMTPEEMAEQLQDERMDVEERVQEATVLDTLTADGDEEGAIERFAGRAQEVDADELFDGGRVETDYGLDTERLGGGGGSPDADGALAEGEEMDEIGGDAEVDTGDRQEQQVETVEVEMREERPDDTGDLDTDRLMQALSRLRNNVEACYQDHLRQNPQARGTVRILITIRERAGRGEIGSAEVAVDEVGTGNSVGNCIARQLETGRIGRLPAPEGGTARITIPYHFSPGG